MKPFLGNFYRHLANFIWSHWKQLAWSEIENSGEEEGGGEGVFDPNFTKLLGRGKNVHFRSSYGISRVDLPRIDKN